MPRDTGRPAWPSLPPTRSAHRPAPPPPTPEQFHRGSSLYAIAYNTYSAPAAVDLFEIGVVRGHGEDRPLILVTGATPPGTVGTTLTTVATVQSFAKAIVDIATSSVPKDQTLAANTVLQTAITNNPGNWYWCVFSVDAQNKLGSIIIVDYYADLLAQYTAP